MFENLKKRLAVSWGFNEVAARDPKKSVIKRIGSALKNRGGSDFEESTVDLNELTKAYNSDSYVKRSIDKYSELMFKEGWEIAGSDETITDYLWMRLKFMEEGTKKSIDELFREISMDIVLYGNAFLVKARQKSGNAIPGMKAVGYTGKQPIAGYFCLPAQTMKISRDETGTITGYQQDDGNGSTNDFKTEDVIHFAYKRPRGRAFGIPYAWPVLPDIKLLRQIEEDVARLIYRNLFPLYQYKIGIDKPGFEADPTEIEEMRELIREMPMDGALVVPERHNISVVSNNGAIMDAQGYLKYFRQRVFSGMGVSDIVMGIGDTANRGTADNLSAEMIDGVKEFQAVFKNVMQREIINELLFEGGYDPVLNKDHEVEFKFHEIELDAKIKKENHLTQMFTQNVITHEELRSQLGLDPVADESRLYFNMVTAALSAQAAQGAADAANNAGNNKDQPANQNGKKTSPGKPKRSKTAASVQDEVNEAPVTEQSVDFSTKALTESSVVVNLHSELKISETKQGLKNLWTSFTDDVLSMVRANKPKDHIEGFVVQLVKQNMKGKIERAILESYYTGINHGQVTLNLPMKSSKAYLEVSKLHKISTSFTDKLVEEIKVQLFKALDESSMMDKLAKINGVFNSNEYRLGFITNTEMYRAYNYGLAIVARDSGLETVEVKHDLDCVKCKNMDQTVDLHSASLLDAIPPHHTNCTCIIKLDTAGEV